MLSIDFLRELYATMLTEMPKVSLNNDVKILDLTGREVQFSPNKLLIYVYDDGTARKVFQVSK